MAKFLGTTPFWTYVSEWLEARKHLRPAKPNALDLGASDYPWKKTYTQGLDVIGATSGREGGEIDLFCAPDYRAETDKWCIDVYDDDLRFHNDGIVRLQINQDGVATFSNDVKAPAAKGFYLGTKRMYASGNAPAFYDAAQTVPMTGPWIFPLKQTADVTLSGTYQAVSEVVKNAGGWTNTFLGTTRTNYKLYVGLTAGLLTPSSNTIEVALYTYRSGTGWYYHATTYTVSGYSAGNNKFLFGPWNWSDADLLSHFCVHAKVTTGSSVVYGAAGTAFWAIKHT